jgi:hypothetical protein
MKNFQYVLAALFLLTVSFASPVCGQSGADILVAGNPPLTQTNADEIIRYYERGLNIEFTAEQRDELQNKVINQWRKFQKINPKSLTAFLGTITKINAWDEAKREKLRDELRKVVLGDLKSSLNNPVSQFVLSVYENAEVTVETTSESSNEATAANNETPAEINSQTSEETTEENYQPVGGALKISDLAGKWAKDPYSVSTTSYTITTNDKGGYKNNTVYTVQPNGNFDFVADTTLYMSRCKTELHTVKKGRISVSGSQAIISFVSGTLQSKDNCSQRGNYTKNLTAERAEFPYRLERDKDKLRLCAVGSSEPNCLYKVKE